MPPTPFPSLDVTAAAAPRAAPLPDTAPAQVQTALCHAGRHPQAHSGAVNVPVFHASTILFPTLEALDAKASAPVRYGRRGTPTTQALEEAVSALEGAVGTVLTPSGAMAITVTLLAHARPGAHYLIPDNVYGPCRHAYTELLQPMGIDCTFYDPQIGAGIARLVRPETVLIWIEPPGSQTFEMPDIRAIVDVARAHGIPTALDNTWSGGLFLQPLAMGVTYSVQAGTKYLCGHSDVMSGTIACAPGAHERMKTYAARLGVCVGPDDAYLVLRGMRTLIMRMRQHHAAGLQVAAWLQTRPEVLRVMHPGLASDPGHALWRRDFTGASGLFGFVLKPVARPALARMMDGLRYYGMGSSWGGFESLLIPTEPAKLRSSTEWAPGGQSMRIHVGLEDPEDLIRDLEAGLARLN
ncbi:cystathionine beta-lyase [Xinfangfangia pollutisoli]|uniref:cystathionine beta-lyase n=1 Tax=Xinfangfangia pollutisoli TaxID=2865960 RepID=UPI001CD41BDC|nr:cystathionine beta-lyase [Xinfangfangia pollutisoli]